MSARCGLSPGNLLAFFKRHAGRGRPQDGGFADGSRGIPTSAGRPVLAGHDHRGQRGETCRPCQTTCRAQTAACRLRSEYTVDEIAELERPFVASRAGGIAFFGHPYRAELRVVDLIDQPLDAKTISVLPPPISATATSRPDTSNARCTLKKASRASSSEEITSTSRSSSLWTRSAKLGAVLGVADGAGRNRRNPADAIAGRDRLEAAERRNRGVGRSF